MRRLCAILLLFAAVPSFAQEKVKAPAPPQVVLETGGHTARVARVFFTADSQELVTVGLDRTIRVWNVTSGELARVYRPSALGEDAGVAVAPDRRTVAMYHGQGVILLLDIHTGTIRLLRLDKLGWMDNLAFSSDGRRLLAGSNNHDCYLLDAQTGRRLQKFEAYAGHFTQVAFDHDGSRATVFNEVPQVFDVKTGKEWPHKIRTASGRCFAWPPDGTFIALGRGQRIDNADRGSGVEYWDLDSGKQLKHIAAGDIEYMQFLPSGELLVAGLLSKDGKARVALLDARTGQERRHFDSPGGGGPYPRSADVSPDGKLVAAAGGPANAAWIWQRHDGTLRHTLSGRGTPFVGAGWHRERKVIAWGGGWQAKASNYWGHRPLHRAFDLAQLEFAAKPVPAEFQRARHKRDGWVLNPDTPRVTKDNKNIDLWSRGLGSRAATLLPGDRVLLGTEHWLVLYDLNKPGWFDKPGNRTVLGWNSWVSTQHLDDFIYDLAPSPDDQYLLSASRDQMLRIWKVEPKSLRLLLSLFVAGQDWIAWTPQGYYAATPGGERLMGFKIDNGVGKLATFYPADRFRSQLYRPDIIRLVIEKGSVPAAVAAANQARGTATREVAVQELLPPRATLTVLDQSNPHRVKLKAAAVAASATQPVQSLRLLIDGRPLPGSETFAEFAGGKATAEVQWEIALPEGKHQFAVLARGADAAAVSPAVTLTNAKPAVLPQLHVLAVGIDKYADTALALTFSTADADALARAFARECRGKPFSQVHTHVLRDADATRDAVLKALDAARKQAKENDLFVVFFAGHGVKTKDEFYLLTVEAQVSDLADTALSGAALRKGLSEFPCQVLLLLDACHSAGFGEGRKLRQADLRPATDDATRALTDDDLAVAVMCAAMGHEKAQEKDGHGLFTQALLEALAYGPAVPRNPFDHQVYVHHLQSYVFDYVSQRSGDRQHPFLSMPWVVTSFPVR